MNGTVSEKALSLLPVTSAQLTAVPGLAETVRTIGADRGIDYLADTEVAALLYRHRELLRRMNSRGAWGGLLFAPGAVGAWFLIDSTDWGDFDAVVDGILLTPVAVLLSLSVYLLARAFHCRHVWVRGGTRDRVNGYLHVLSAAGIPYRALPAWLKPTSGKRWR
ncbi:hypothetical protein [Streptomyces sp. CRN 30]|uniref:hypothetical protein n=1 Tax=Streptomyces sp. CRN 30 TaxID=3075613 RepID=UPI002A7F7AB3|nr:hypothetical protein [Streptomyces sp. CRN 30]